MELIDQAGDIFFENFKPVASFERAIFLSWYCGKGDCAFCYMSTQKDLISDPRKARRSKESVIAEALISKACGWEVEFLSGGYDSYTIEEIADTAKEIMKITGKRQWLNIGTLNEAELKTLLPYSEGYIGTLECANSKLRGKLCPSKPMKDIFATYKTCDKLGLKKGATVIIGLGETLDDFESLKEFIAHNDLSRITFYSLNPQKGTVFTKSPPIDYYEQWIAKTRISFPKLHIVAGAWSDKTLYFSRLLKAGANNFTKIPAIKIFGTEKAREIEKEVKSAGRTLQGTLTKLPKIESGNKALQRYLKSMQR
jgi:biotin synthase-like enzyme